MNKKKYAINMNADTGKPVKKSVVDYPLPFSTGFNAKIHLKLKNNNVATHSWIADIDRACVCMVCDCKLLSNTSEWPCGYPVPRVGDLK